MSGELQGDSCGSTSSDETLFFYLRTVTRQDWDCGFYLMFVYEAKMFWKSMRADMCM